MCLSQNGIIKTSIDYRRIANSKSNKKHAFDSDIRLIYAELIPYNFCFFFQTCRARPVSMKRKSILFCFCELMIFPWKPTDYYAIELNGFFFLVYSLLNQQICQSSMALL